MIRIKKIVDLSHPLNRSVQVYPGDPIPDFTIATTIEDEGYNLFNLILGSQTGSHVDAPYHFKDDGQTIDQVDLRKCIGSGVVINVSYKKAKEEISVADLQPYQKQISESEIVLLRTDWYLKAGSDDFFNHPYLSETAGNWLLEQRIFTVGIDAINLDNTGGTAFPIHEAYASQGGLIAENLAHFDRIDFKHPFIITLPLPLEGCDGSPVRAIAVQFE